MFNVCTTCGEKETEKRRAEYIAAERDRIPALVEARLGSLGMGHIERGATLESVPLPIKRALPIEATKAILDGRAPAQGFGLCGGQGIGKTMALAAILRHGTAVAMLRALEAIPYVPEPYEVRWHEVGGFRWVSWPATAAELKARVARDKGTEAVEVAIERAIRAPLLVLDDLGRERMRGGYTEDYAVGQLDRIVDARAREGRPIVWTANSGARELSRVYGGALASRLLGLAPAVDLPRLADLRLAKAAPARASA